tara:strand:- start:547 stop:786 length:240 start_codon:yes stop_codon:yes gene_type:complete
MNYFKSVGFYSFELLGGMLNFLCSLLGMYPAFDLGVHFLLYFEGKRIFLEKTERASHREGKEQEATTLKDKATGNEQIT